MLSGTSMANEAASQIGETASDELTAICNAISDHMTTAGIVVDTQIMGLVGSTVTLMAAANMSRPVTAQLTGFCTGAVNHILTGTRAGLQISGLSGPAMAELIAPLLEQSTSASNLVKLCTGICNNIMNEAILVPTSLTTWKIT